MARNSEYLKVYRAHKKSEILPWSTTAGKLTQDGNNIWICLGTATRSAGKRSVLQRMSRFLHLVYTLNWPALRNYPAPNYDEKTTLHIP